MTNPQKPKDVCENENTISSLISTAEKGCGKNYCYGKCGDKSHKTGEGDKILLCHDCKITLSTLKKVEDIIKIRIKNYENEEIRQRKLTKGYEGLSSDEEGALNELNLILGDISAKRTKHFRRRWRMKW